MNNLNDCYIYLGVNQNTSFEDIQKIYKTKAKELHPDLNQKDDATENFQQLNNAFNYIKNNYSKYQETGEEIEYENGLKIVVSFGNEVDINKYKNNLSNLSCQCPDWLGRRSHFSIKDPRRLCKHLIASFEKNDSVLIGASFNIETLLKHYQNIIKVPDNLQKYSASICDFFDEGKGFDLYWHEDKYETNNIVIYYNTKFKYTSSSKIYIKGYNFEISCRLEHYDNLKTNITLNNVLFDSVGLGIFLKFCNQSIFNDIQIFISTHNKFKIAFNRLLDYYNNDYHKFGRKFLCNVKNLTQSYESNNYYTDNVNQVSDKYYFSPSYFISNKLYRLQEQYMSKYDELNNILKSNPQYKLNTRTINTILNKIGVIKKDEELNNNNWTIVNTYEKFGINFIKNTDKQNDKIPDWYNVYYYNKYNLQPEKYKENERLNHTRILFDLNLFEELYNMCLNFKNQAEMKVLDFKNTLKKRSIKQYEDREYWIDNIKCPNCKENNLHKKDKRERKTNTIQRFYCNDCNKIFQIDYTEFSEIVKYNKENKDVQKQKKCTIKNNILEEKKQIDKEVNILKKDKKSSFLDTILNLFR